MKVLWIGINAANSGYDVVTKNALKALDKVGVDVVYRHVNLSSSKPNYKEIQHLIDKSEEGCDKLVIHGLPYEFRYDGRFKKCIGYFAWETSNFKNSSWTKNLNQMDEVWVISKQQQQACQYSGVTKPVHLIPHCFDINKYFQKWDSQNPIITGLKDNGNFKFYTIGEFNRRKNFAALIKAFHLEFKPNEPVDLVLKTNKSGFNPEQLKHEVRGFCTEMKKGLKLYGNNLFSYKEEIIITEDLSDSDINALHQACDCFVSPSYGEAGSLPSSDAQGFNKRPIVTKGTGFDDYISPYLGMFINSRPEPVFGMMDTFPDLYTGYENWMSVDIGYLQFLMRFAYKTQNDKINDTEKCNILKKFSYETVGQSMKERLEA